MARDLLVGLVPTPVVYHEGGSRSAVVAEAIFGEAIASNDYSLTSDAGAFTLSGQAAVFGQVAAKMVVLAGHPTPIIVTESADRSALYGHTIYTEVVASTSYSITAERGVYVLTGQDAVLASSDLFQPERGVFLWSGQTANLRRGKVITAGTGAFTYTLAGVLQIVEAFAGHLAVTGQPATLTYAPSTIKLIAEATSFVTDGQDATLSLDTAFVADGGTFSVGGQDATFLRPYRVVATTGVFTVTGRTADLNAPSIIAYPLFARTITI